MTGKKSLEKKHGVHSDEQYPHDKAKSVADRYAEHIKMHESNALDSEKIIDATKRGKAQDITHTGKLKLKEPEFNG